MSTITKYSKVINVPYDPTQIVVGGSDIRIYKINQQPYEKGFYQFNLIGINTDVPQMRCFDINPDPSFKKLIAVGQSTGKVSLINMNSLNNSYSTSSTPTTNASNQYNSYETILTTANNNNNIIHTFQLRNPRPCNTLQFNSLDSRFLACGIDKVRNDTSLLIYDIQRVIMNNNTNKKNPFNWNTNNVNNNNDVNLSWNYFLDSNRNTNPRTTRQTTPTFSPKFKPTQLPDLMSDLATIRSISSHRMNLSGINNNNNDFSPALYSLANSEAVYSLNWSNNNVNELIIGLASKKINLIDLRDSSLNNNNQLIINSKCINNLNWNPFNNYQFMGTSDDGIIQLYDLRKPTTSLLSIDTKLRYLTANFHPNQNQQIILHDKEENNIYKYYLIENYEENEKENINSLNLYRKTQLLNSDLPISCYSWLPNLNLKNLSYDLLIIRKDGEFNIKEIYEPSSISLNNLNHLTLFNFNQLITFDLNNNNNNNNDNNNNTSIAFQIKMDSNQNQISHQQQQLKNNKPKRVHSPYPDTLRRLPSKMELENILNQRSINPFKILNNINNNNSNDNKDILLIMIERAKLGYNLNIKKNLMILFKDDELNYIWKVLLKWDQLFKLGLTKINNFELAFTSLIVGLGLNNGNQRTNSHKKGSMSSNSIPSLNDTFTTLNANSIQSIGLKKAPSHPQSSSTKIKSPPLIKNNEIEINKENDSTLLDEDDLLISPRKVLILEIIQPFDIPLYKIKENNKLILSKENINKIINNLKNLNQISKAALFALIFLNLEQSLIILSESNNEIHQLVSLLNFNNNNNNNNSLLYKIIQQTEDVYLQSILGFLIHKDYIVLSKQLTLPLSFRLMSLILRLESNELKLELESIVNELIQQESILALIVLGFLSTASYTFMSHFADSTMDIQTLALITSLTLPFVKSKLVTNFKPSIWSQSYSELLDRWEFFKIRCEYDILKSKISSNINHIKMDTTNNNNLSLSSQILVRCNFCNSNIGPTLPNIGLPNFMINNNISNPSNKYRNRPALSTPPITNNPTINTNSTSLSSTNQPTSNNPTTPSNLNLNREYNKPIACPTCRKPLPRCALCLLHLGVPIDPLNPYSLTMEQHHPSLALNTVPQESGATEHVNLLSIVNEKDKQIKPLPFHFWFTWCQTCRHGGHALHLDMWFEQHTKCPVAGCDCQCNSL